MRGCEKEVKGRNAAKGRKGRKEGRSLLSPSSGLRSVPFPCVPPFRRSFLCVPVLPAFRCVFPLLCCAFRSFLRYAVRSVSFPFPSLCCAAVRFPFRSVSVLTMAGQHRTGQQGSTGTKQGHGDRLKRFRPERNEGGGVGENRHFVH